MEKKLFSIISLLRPHQWLKNLLILFPPFFARKMASAEVLAAIVPSLVSFSFAASSVYIFNDILDKESDQHHPGKRTRAIASGNLSIPTALVISIGLVLVSLLLAATVSRTFEAYLIIYALLSILYTIYLKHIVILEMFIVAFGFLLRILAGGEAFRVAISNWLFLTVFVVALFLASGKRLGELISLGEAAGRHRKSLSLYNRQFLESVQWLCAAVAIVTYALYTIENKSGLFYSFPLAIYGFLRYIYVVRSGTGDPTEVLLKDWQLMITGILWITFVALNVYR
jgi:decaprenyl-phosphate phosphoribosyltransferase